LLDHTFGRKEILCYLLSSVRVYYHRHHAFELPRSVVRTAQLVGLPPDVGQYSSINALLYRESLNGASLRRIHGIMICIVLW
jgi:hypothetical protein